MKKGMIITLSIVFSILLAMHMIISIIMVIGLNPKVYKKAQIADDIATYAEMEQSTLDIATIGLIDYMAGRRSSLVIMNPEKEGHELFNTKEKTHMIDVKNLFILGKKINLAIFIILLLLLFLFIGYDKPGMRKYYMKYCAISLIIILGIWIIVAVLAMIDFSSFWTSFHKIFFTNNLWMLNPSTDLLIRMMPQRFFTRVVIQILVRFITSYVIVLAVLTVGHFILNKKLSKKRVKKVNRG